MKFDRLPRSAGWRMRDYPLASTYGAQQVAIRKSPSLDQHVEVDYLLYIDGIAASVTEYAKQGALQSSIERQPAPTRVP